MRSGCRVALGRTDRQSIGSCRPQHLGDGLMVYLAWRRAPEDDMPFAQFPQASTLRMQYRGLRSLSRYVPGLVPIPG